MIDLIGKEYKTAGIHGAYYKLNNAVGVKLIHSPKFRSMRAAYKSQAHRDAMEESNILALAMETGIVPETYGVTLVKVRGGYRVGVLMQHLGNKTLAESEFYDDENAHEYLYGLLKDVGIKHHDLHEDNIMVYRGKLYAVDFSPECITLV